MICSSIRFPFEKEGLRGFYKCRNIKNLYWIRLSGEWMEYKPLSEPKDFSELLEFLDKDASDVYLLKRATTNQRNNHQYSNMPFHKTEIITLTSFRCVRQ